MTDLVPSVMFELVTMKCVGWLALVLVLWATVVAAEPAAVQLTKVALVVEGEKALSKSIKYPTPLATVVHVGIDDTITFSFGVTNAQTASPLNAHQAMVRFSTAVGEEVVFLATKTSDMYKISLTPSDAAEAFRRMTGEFSVEIIVGSLDIVPLRWIAGKVYLHFPEVGETNQHSAYNVLPTFSHVFRSPDKRASAFMSLLFSGVVILPTLLVFVMWARLGVNVANFPPKGAAVSALAFHLLIAAIFALIAWYWLELTVFEFAVYLVPLGIAAIFLGSSTLSKLAQEHTT